MKIHPSFIQSGNLTRAERPYSNRICELSASPNLVPPAPWPPSARDEQLLGTRFHSWKGSFVEDFIQLL